MMKYKVVPFAPALDRKNPSSDAAAVQLTNAIAKHSQEGWEYVRIETVTAHVAADAGCFGLFGGSPSYNISAQMIVFEKAE